MEINAMMPSYKHVSWFATTNGTLYYHNRKSRYVQSVSKFRWISPQHVLTQDLRKFWKSFICGHQIWFNKHKIRSTNYLFISNLEGSIKQELEYRKLINYFQHFLKRRWKVIQAPTHHINTEKLVSAV